VGRLQQITVPALLVNGRYDTAQDWVVESFFKELPHVKWVRFDSEGSSHTPMWEDRERYMQLLKEFLSE
jgi:pimeloyl-ACP methyl ester carboxylesterase